MMAVIISLYLVMCTIVDLAFTVASEVDEPNYNFNPSNNFEKTSDDQNFDSTMFEDSMPFGSQNQGNYFMYQRVPKKGHYDLAYKRGNEHHWREHNEKAVPHEGHFKIQARWGDQNGGYGEHYWDYNHGGDSQEGTAGIPVHEDVNGEPSRNIQSPSLVRPSSDASNSEQDYVEPEESINVSSTTTTTTPAPRRKTQKRRNKTRYENPPKRKPKLESSEAQEGSTNEQNSFVLPRTTVYPTTSTETMLTRKKNQDQGPYRVDLNEQLKDMPRIYNHHGDRLSSSSSYRQS